jgi:hypothetical protein
MESANKKPSVAVMTFLPHTPDPAFSILPGGLKVTCMGKVEYEGIKDAGVAWLVSFLSHPTIGCGIVTKLQESDRTSTKAFGEVLLSDPGFNGLCEAIGLK